MNLSEAAAATRGHCRRLACSARRLRVSPDDEMTRRHSLPPHPFRPSFSRRAASRTLSVRNPPPVTKSLPRWQGPESPNRRRRTQDAIMRTLPCHSPTAGKHPRHLLRREPFLARVTIPSAPSSSAKRGMAGALGGPQHKTRAARAFFPLRPPRAIDSEPQWFPDRRRKSS